MNGHSKEQMDVWLEIEGVRHFPGRRVVFTTQFPGDLGGDVLVVDEVAHRHDVVVVRLSGHLDWQRDNDWSALSVVHIVRELGFKLIGGLSVDDVVLQIHRGTFHLGQRCCQ